MTSDTVILSPHLDDAVLSLGGLISREVAAGRSVEVVSCFTSGPPLDTIAPAHRVFGDYSMRRAEDERAMAILGARYRWLDLHERIWRQPALPGRTPPASAGSNPARRTDDLPLPDGPTMPRKPEPTSRATSSATSRSRPKK